MKSPDITAEHLHDLENPVLLYRNFEHEKTLHFRTKEHLIVRVTMDWTLRKYICSAVCLETWSKHVHKSYMTNGNVRICTESSFATLNHSWVKKKHICQNPLGTVQKNLNKDSNAD